MKPVLLLLIASVWLTGCSLSPVAASDNRTYSLMALPKHTPISLQHKQSILVTNTVAEPSYNTDQMVYTKKPFEISYFAKHFWVSPPAKMITPLLVQTIIQTKRFHAVLAPPFSGETDYRLDTQLLSLRQEFLTRPSRIRIAIQAEVFSNKKNKVIASHLFQTVTLASRDEPYAGVIAANKGMQKLLTQLAGFVIKVTG